MLPDQATYRYANTQRQTIHRINYRLHVNFAYAFNLSDIKNILTE